MIYGILKDIKEGEFRVICTPLEVSAIIGAGHTVLVEKDAGNTRDSPMRRTQKSARKLWILPQRCGQAVTSSLR